MTERIVILGGGLAGGNAAVTLREEGFTGPVTLVGREPGVPFGRPPLSKTYLRSEEELDGWYVRPASWYDEHDIERLTAEVTGIDAAAHTLALGSGQDLEYRRLLLATGGQPHRLRLPRAGPAGVDYLRTASDCEAHEREGRRRLPGAGLAGVHSLRTAADCEAIKREARPGRRAVVVGMSFIGSEVAAS